MSARARRITHHFVFKGRPHMILGTGPAVAHLGKYAVWAYGDMVAVGETKADLVRALVGSRDCRA